MQFQKKVTKTNYIREYVTVLNGLLDLTPREIDLVIAFIKLDINWVQRHPNETKNLLSTDSRRLLMKDVNMNKSNFQKIVHKLLSLGLLIKEVDGNTTLNEYIKPNISKDNTIEVKFVLTIPKE